MRAGASGFGIALLSLLPRVGAGGCSCDLDLTQVKHNNLGAQGPDPGDTDPTLVFKDVCSPDGKPVDLVVETTGEYATTDDYMNGKSQCGPYGEINVQKGKKVDLKATFKRGDETVEVESFFLSFFDMDLGGAHHAKVTVLGFDEFYLSTDSEVQHDNIVNGAVFTSPEKTEPVNCPENPLGLAPEQQKVTVSMLFKDTSSFSFSLEVLGSVVEGRSHNFLMGGTTSMRTECKPVSADSGPSDAPAPEPAAPAPPAPEPDTPAPTNTPAPPPPPAATPAPPAADAERKCKLPDVKKDCGSDGCKVLADHMTGRDCTYFCKRAGLGCKGAWEEVNNDCAVKEELKCDQVFQGTSDLICECDPNVKVEGASAPAGAAPAGAAPAGVPPAPAAPAPPAPQPLPRSASDCSGLKDVKLKCGLNDCKVLANKMTSKTCDAYCRENGLVCRRGAEEEDDDCTEKSELDCAAVFPGTSDLICECGIPDAASATTLSQMANLGEDKIHVKDTSKFQKGDYIEIINGDFYETQIVTDVGAARRLGESSAPGRRLQQAGILTLGKVLKGSYDENSNVVKIVTEGATVAQGTPSGSPAAAPQVADVTPLTVDAGSLTCKDGSHWPDKDGLADCGTCRYRVSVENFHSCETYCQSFGQECFHAAEDANTGDGDQSCVIAYNVSCRDDLRAMQQNSRDMICGCRFPQGALRTCAPPSKWPHLDGESDCGHCKHLVTFGGDFRSCGEYCHSFGQECFYAAEDRNQPGGDNGECEVQEDFACSTDMLEKQVNSNDMICGCQDPQSDCPAFDQWPDRDGDITCGKCKALIQITHHETCEAYCASFGQRCFYAAEDREGADSSVHANGCVAQEEVTCTDNLKELNAKKGSSDMICGCANIQTVGPTAAPTVPPPAPLPDLSCKAFGEWPEKDTSSDCGKCKHIVKVDKFASCDAYCQSFEQECWFAAEDLDDATCSVKQEVSCRTDLRALQVNSQDMICGCRDPQEVPKQCKDFSEWPDKDGDVSCGPCKHLIQVNQFKTCSEYCASFNQECFYAAEDLNGPNGDQCVVAKDLTCNSNILALPQHTSDMICGCQHPEERCDDRTFWPDLDGSIECGKCKHLVKMTNFQSCQAYCHSFGHRCFYAAQDEIGDDVTVHVDGCAIKMEVDCSEDMSRFLGSTNDMICGCTNGGPLTSGEMTPAPTVPIGTASEFGCKPFSQWPDKDGPANCGQCKHRVTIDNFKSCETYCESFGQECFFAGDDMPGADSAGCLVASKHTCRADLAAVQANSRDMICGCRNPQAPPKQCASFTQWPDKDGTVDCGPCKHLVLVNDFVSCKDYCASFGHECFYAAEDKNGPGGDTGECAVLQDVACDANMQEIQQNSNDMICGCQQVQECKDFSSWPDKNGDVQFGQCTHSVTMDHYSSCDNYCASFQQICFFAAEHKQGTNMAGMEVLCSDDVSSFSTESKMICGCANPQGGQQVIVVPPAPTLPDQRPNPNPAPAPTSAGSLPISCKSFDEWPDKDGTGDCGACRHLVQITEFKSCEAYCESFGQECFFAAEDKNGANGQDTGMCIVDRTFSCREDLQAQQVNSRDMICGCQNPQEPEKQCKDFGEWPDKDGDTICGPCKHLVLVNAFNSCKDYCESFDQECFYAAEDKNGPGGDSCEVQQDVTCDADLRSMQVNSNDMICGCQSRQEQCAPFEQWPNTDGVECGACKHLVKKALAYKSCQEYCASFGHRCFYAAADKHGIDSAVHANGCAVQQELTCADDISEYDISFAGAATTDMICGCTTDGAAPAPAPPGPPDQATGCCFSYGYGAMAYPCCLKTQPASSESECIGLGENNVGGESGFKQGACPTSANAAAKLIEANKGSASAAAGTPSGAASVVKAGSRCEPQRWLDEYASQPAGCMEHLKKAGDCSLRFFNHATGSDGNCGCVTDLSVDCSVTNNEDLTDDVVSIYEFTPGAPTVKQQTAMQDQVVQKYDCDEGYADWTTKWDSAKKDYCCSQEGRGCVGSEAAAQAGTDKYDCSSSKLWTLAQVDWCCANKGKGCPTTSKPFDCSTRELWSLEKKMWCCQNERQGCESSDTNFDCAVGAEDPTRGWSDEKKDYCCRNSQIGCDAGVKLANDADAGYNCDAGDMAAWSSEKKEFCCFHTADGKGCNEQAKFQMLRTVAGMEPRQLLGYFFVAGCVVASAALVSYRRSSMRLAVNTRFGDPAYATVLMRAETESEE